MLIDCHVHLLPPRRLAGLMKWIHSFYPQHPVPPDVTVADCLRDYDALGVDYLFNLVYPLWPGEAEEVNRFNAELHRAHPWIIPFGRDRGPGPRRARLPGLQVPPVRPALRPARPAHAAGLRAAAGLGPPGVLPHRLRGLLRRES